MKRIAYILDRLTVVGGIGRVVTMKANWWAEHGYDVTILTTEGDSTESFYHLHPSVRVEALNINFLAVYDNRRSVTGILKSGLDRYRKNRLFRQRMGDFLLRHPQDVVFTTGNNPDLLRIGDGSLKIYETHFSVQSQLTFMASLPALQRLLYRLHCMSQDRVLSRYDRVVLLTRRDYDLRGGLKNAVVIPNFITVPIQSREPAYDAKRAILVGRLSDPKGLDYLFPAWRLVADKHPAWHLDIYGHSYGREAFYQQLIAESGVEEFVQIHPAVTNIEEQYLASAFYVMSSRYEGFPLVLPEAMACGLACIAYDCNCGPADIICDGEDGILLPEVGNVQQLADAICRMIEHPEMRREMGRRAKENVQRFAIDTVMQRWVQLIDEMSSKQ